ncbi:probable RNA methyltransferase At5g51130 isoform X1 [Phoenix dactylifera]|uniref:RNA methyltransferase n=1 Tax=Phoenix dactylifera TaxID=42345 RepID=A0A8B9APQ8_PHODC|nr:probable RNA methyltransferase At5g51130 isoform X1 [Phoenix dactylifera]
MEAQEDVRNTACGHKRKQVFIYGNYKNYYGYRIDQNQREDPRLAVMKKGWFEGKDCLDIGCNQGLITIEIAKKFFCRSILGIDIDAGLIEAANWNLRKIARIEQSNRRSKEASDSQILDGSNYSKHKVSQASDGETFHIQHDASSLSEGTLFERVTFRKENFVGSMDKCSEKYDTILCLSVTKWIHLNWGDDGLITMFVKIWRLLRPGGILLLEPQPWSSYKKNRLVSETARVNYNEITLHPGEFRDILLDKVGFRSAEPWVAHFNTRVPSLHQHHQHPFDKSKTDNVEEIGSLTVGDHLKFDIDKSHMDWLTNA